VTIKVLVVDRTRNADQLAKEALVPLGCQIITATSTALGVFLARKNFPSLVIAGIGDTDDHTDLAREIKDDPDLAHIPVVYIANEGREVQNLGATKYLYRPLDGKHLIAEVLPYLRESVDDRPEDTPE
jgi:DNA-binding response OmpR family regulator